MSLSTPVQNEWLVLDKIIAGVVQWGSELKLHPGNNGRQMTCLLKSFAVSCGMTELVYKNLFDARNKLKRAVMEGHGVSFPSRSLCTYSTRKIQIDFASNIPCFYELFCNALPQQHQHPIFELNDVAVENQVPLFPPQNADMPAPPQSPTIVDLRKQRHITVKNANNKQSYWVNIPSATEVINNEQHFRSVCNKLKLKTVLKEIAGTTAQGVYLLTKRLHKIDKAESLRAMETLGLKPFVTLSPAATVAAKSYANISGKALIKLNSFLRHYNHKKSIFAPRSRCKLIKPKHTVPPVHGQYKYKESLGHGLFKWVNVRYWVRSPDKVFEATLKNMRDAPVPDPRPLGVPTGPGVDAISVLIQGDHGGDSMKFVQVFIGRDGDNQRYTTQLASLNATESHAILKHTVMTTINDGVRRLNNNLLLLVTWGVGQFDFVLVPVGTPQDALDFLWIQNNNVRHLRVIWPDGSADFERTDIPNNFDTHSVYRQGCLCEKCGNCKSNLWIQRV